jgi:hypothetical protein
MKRYILSTLATLAMAAVTVASAQVRQIASYTLLSAATATGAGPTAQGLAYPKTYQASGTTSSGSGSATVAVQCSNDGTNWDTLGTITLTLSTTTSSNSFASDDRCFRLRGNVTAISGTGAAVTLTMGF